MWISEICGKTGLTKKAVEYYIGRGLLSPGIHENGYRDFSADDLQRLKKISILRSLGLSCGEMRAVLEDKTDETLSRLCISREWRNKQEQARYMLLCAVRDGAPLDGLQAELRRIGQRQTIAQKLLDAFPGIFGRFICLHFEPYLGEPIETASQQQAYDEIVDFLDHVPLPAFTEDLQAALSEYTRHLNTQHIRQISRDVREAVEHPAAFFEKNSGAIHSYLAYKESEEYRDSPVYRMECLLRQFQQMIGYNETFLPAMRRLSPSYGAYCKKLESVNEMLLDKYPELRQKDETQP